MNSSGSSNGVICRRCHKAVRLERSDKLAEEFSVACPHCGLRAIYQVKDVKPVGDAPSR